MDSIAILDFGSQYTQLIARRIRELHVHSDIFSFDASPDAVLSQPRQGFVLSGGPASVYDPGAPQIPSYVLRSGLPVLGICYGMQALTHALGGRVAPSGRREYGPSEIEVIEDNPLLPSGRRPVWMSHGDRIENLPPGFQSLARSTNSPIAAMGDLGRRLFGLQFHPEVAHTPDGSRILAAFVLTVCQAHPDWTPAAMVAASVTRVQNQVAGERALAAVSGGVDSLVAAALAQRALGERLTGIFVNTGLMRQDEPEQVVQALRDVLSVRLSAVDASEAFLDALSGVTDPEAKRRVIGERFIRVFEEQAARQGRPRFLVQGTIYPDVIESSRADGRIADRIKTHHNVGGLPADLGFELVEPLRDLFKDEVRAVGEALGLPAHLVWRQPFPGPGLAVRCLGEVTFSRLETLRSADRIFLEELRAAGWLGSASSDGASQADQAFAVLLPVRSVGVMGDQRTYAEVVALRAVSTSDYMTADWARLPSDVLARTANRIVNEVPGVNRVVYDVTSKPPATIEWE
ncbi:MAG: glutamine-hydrolyzing GMP synthase [Anaerolineales bacterium]